jgi:Holliday junction DNA helicase RuvA
MIAKLKGILDDVGEDRAVVDVAGVGYLVFCSAKTLSQLPPVGEVVTLVIETHVREDHIHLYGFISDAEKIWFSRLQDVQGVGARVAMAILAVLDPAELSQTILAQDKTMIGRANGVGPKLATRIINELKDKVPAIGDIPSFRIIGADVGPQESVLGDAVSALVNLGYRQADVMNTVVRISQAADGEPNLQELIRHSLKELSACVPRKTGW